jgi:hypothetical protein
LREEHDVRVHTMHIDQGCWVNRPH